MANIANLDCLIHEPNNPELVNLESDRKTLGSGQDHTVNIDLTKRESASLDSQGPSLFLSDVSQHLITTHRKFVVLFVSLDRPGPGKLQSRMLLSKPPHFTVLPQNKRNMLTDRLNHAIRTQNMPSTGPR